jgi:hypothetical protein
LLANIAINLPEECPKTMEMDNHFAAFSVVAYSKRHRN